MSARAWRSASNRLHDFQRHLAPDRFPLLGQIDDPHPSLTEQLDQPVGADPGPHVDVRPGRPVHRLVTRAFGSGFSLVGSRWNYWN